MSHDTGKQATYILPIRCADARKGAEIASYLCGLPIEQIIVVDGSPPSVFAAHARMLPRRVEHVPPSPAIAGLNGKVRGVLTGARLARHDRIVIADDDIRYDERSLRDVLSALDHADVVRPQNYFSPLPWHAALDSSRSLINRALDGDWPGTLGVRASALAGGYDADVLFENLELVRSVRARGGHERVAREIFVRRLPPSAAHFASQRVRQAYDEFARPPRLILALAILPLLGVTSLQARWPIAASILLAPCILAAAGWLRAGGFRRLPAVAVLLAPLWMLERACCSWLALYERVRFGGVRYAGSVIRVAATPSRQLQSRCTA